MGRIRPATASRSSRGPQMAQCDQAREDGHRRDDGDDEPRDQPWGQGHPAMLPEGVGRVNRRQTPSLLAKKSWMYRSSCSRKWNSMTSSIENAGPDRHGPLRVGAVEQHRRLSVLTVGLCDVDPGRDQERHDLTISALLHVVGASRAGETGSSPRVRRLGRRAGSPRVPCPLLRSGRLGLDGCSSHPELSAERNPAPVSVPPTGPPQGTGYPPYRLRVALARW